MWGDHLWQQFREKCRDRRRHSGDEDSRIQGWKRIFHRRIYHSDYKIFIQYESEGKHDVTRRLSFQDYTKTGRGIRIIPRTSNYGTDKTQKEVEAEVKKEYGIGGAARIRIPTIYLSLSRLYPLGEKSNTKVLVRKISKRNALCQEDVRERFRTWYNAVIPNAIKEDAAGKNHP